MRKWYGYIAVLVLFLLISILVACFLKAGLIQSENMQLERARDEQIQGRASNNVVAEDEEIQDDTEKAAKDDEEKQHEGEIKSDLYNSIEESGNSENNYDLQVPTEQLH